MLVIEKTHFAASRLNSDTGKSGERTLAVDLAGWKKEVRSKSRVITGMVVQCCASMTASMDRVFHGKLDKDL